jgi:O-antigen/teichoic acid export membrane protein
VTSEQLTEEPQGADLDVRGPGLLAAGILVMNVTTFGFQILAARILGPGGYGGLAAMLNLLLVVAVVQLGLQATAARRVADAPGDVRSIERTMKAVTNRAAIAVTVLMLALSPLVMHGLKLPSIWPAILVAVCACPITIWGGQAGILQGERRWRELALLYLANGVPRFLLGPLFMLAHPTETSAMMAVTIAQFAPAIVGWWVLREKHVHEPHPDLKGAVNEAMHGSFALLGFFALSNVDILIARHILPEDGKQAGLYAAGLIVSKVVLFLPQSVIVLVFPSLSQEGSARRALRLSLGVVAILGAVSIVGAWVLSGLALVFVGGNAFSDVQDDLWRFAVLGTVLSVLQMLVYSVLARQHRGSSVLIWLAFGAVVGFGLMQTTLTGLITAVTIIDGILMVLLLAHSLWDTRRTSVPAAVEA